MPVQRSHTFGVGMGEEQKMMDFEGLTNLSPEIPP
jgi:hypothetical protein